MKILRCGLISFCILAFTQVMTAQENYPKTMLWRISGHNLQQPSYLFGTMHLTDKRLFYFTDSLYHAIEHTEGLAIEVSPDEMAAYVITKMFDQGLSGKKLRDILSGKDFKTYGTRLAKKIGKPEAEITTSDILKEKNKWISNAQKNSMETFVDAYLYGIAKKQGKWVGGVEDLADQTGLVDELIDSWDIQYVLADDRTEANKGLESLKAAYINQDLNAIESISGGISALQKDALLVKRNKKMANRMDSLAAIRSTFFAVGAAHLPGITGLIHLLREKGYQVDAVLSGKKLAPEKYTFKEVPAQWTNIQDKNNMYEVAMPGTPTSMKLFGFLDGKFLMDITNMTCYFTYAAVSTGAMPLSDSTLKATIRNMYPKTRISFLNDINNDSVKGKQFFVDADDQKLKIQLLFSSNRLFFVAMAAAKKEPLFTADGDRFFHSFTINKVPAANVTQNHVFRDTMIRVQFMAPVPFEFNDKMSNNTDSSWKTSAYTAVDMNQGMYLMLFLKELKRGRYITSDTSVQHNLFTFFKEHYKTARRENTLVSGMPATRFSLSQPVTGPAVSVEVLSVIRGNRNLLLMLTADSTAAKKSLMNNIFSSFELLPYRETTGWNTVKAPDNLFSVWAPSSFTRKHDEINQDDSTIEYLAYDTLSSTSFSVMHQAFDKYYWTVSDSAFRDDKIDPWIEKGDSFLYNKEVSNNDIPGRELLLNKPGLNVYRRIRFLPVANGMYVLYSSSQADALATENVNRFFESFSIPGASHAATYLQSKTTLLLGDLMAADSITRSAAIRQLRNAPFSDKDVMQLNEALFKIYPGAPGDAIWTNMSVCKQLKTLGNPATVDFISAHYPSLQDEDMKDVVLNTLSGIYTRSSYDTLAKLITTYKPAEAPGYTIRSNLQDSLALTAGIFNQVKGLLTDSAWAPAIAKIALTLLDSGYIKPGDIGAQQDQLETIAARMLPALKSADSYDYEVNAIYTLLVRLKTGRAIDLLKKLQSAKDNWLKQDAVITLLKNGQHADPATIMILAADTWCRQPFYKELEETGTQNLFPKNYLTQKYFSESSLVNSYEDEIPSKLLFIKEKNAMVKGKLYTFYLYKADFGKGSGKESYLGIAGGYLPGSNKPDEEENMSGYYMDEPYAPASTDKYFSAYIRSLSEEED